MCTIRRVSTPLPALRLLEIFPIFLVVAPWQRRRSLAGSHT
jgi:hypothetical protein